MMRSNFSSGIDSGSRVPGFVERLERRALSQIYETSLVRLHARSDIGKKDIRWGECKRWKFMD